MPDDSRRFTCATSALYVEKSFESNTFNEVYCGNGLKKNGRPAESCVTETPPCRRVAMDEASAPTEFKLRLEANKRRTICDPVSPALSRESVLRILFIKGESPVFYPLQYKVSQAKLQRVD